MPPQTFLALAKFRHPIFGSATPVDAFSSENSLEQALMAHSGVTCMDTDLFNC